MTSPLVPQAIDPAPGVEVPTCPCCGQADRVILWGYPTHTEGHDWWCSRCVGWLDWLRGVKDPPPFQDPKPQSKRKGAKP